MPRPDRSTKPTDARAAKVAQIQKASRSAERTRGALIWGVAALVVAAIVGSVAFVIIRESPATADLSAVTVSENTGGDHRTTPIDYDSAVPAGGPHHPAWWNCGVYSEPVRTEHAVHSLEHGAVWLSYRPDLPADQVALLEELGDEDYMLVSPVEDQESPVIATAWDHQLSLDSAEEKTLKAFIREYKQGPQTPEPGAACTGGTDVSLVAGS
ncbi:DUF3105 domain-containing protein [Ornithinimicrobium avium]|uniref:DUF3105 domain-containing protein n=1 Tax=Ornithinimicrobium avium TaxID=2283195 RepID=A0A345NLI5_9MICO|nr:DUF3105 domain-containing protein [Ornithinimicrobium avium]AXH95893.1 DUF3105 domain-containing protein [Ornithinimicrobium avium]